jgi:hypothetical protein
VGGFSGVARVKVMVSEQAERQLHIVSSRGILPMTTNLIHILLAAVIAFAGVANLSGNCVLRKMF